MNALDWEPRPFTAAELEEIDPIIVAYMKDVDQRSVVAALRMTPHERVAGLQKMNEDLAQLRKAATEE